MSVTDGFVAFVLEQLDPIGAITPKRMFGGVALYAGDLCFALIAGDTLFLKTDETTRAAFRAAGARPLRPRRGRARAGTTPYYSVPAGVLEDGDALIDWARKAVDVARRKPSRHS